MPQSAHLTVTPTVPAAQALLPPPRPVEELGEEIAALAARIQAATYQLLVMIREFDERAGWDSGFRSCAHWLNWRIGLGLPAAREKVRVARALGELPRVSEAMRRGAVSFSKVRAITRVATPQNEEELLGFAVAGTAAHVERLVRAWRQVDRAEELQVEALRHSSRSLSAWVDEDGMVVVRGRLSPGAGALLLRALDAAEERLFDTGKEEARGRESMAQRRSDALGLIAESALAHELDPGTRGDRFQVVVHVDAEALAGGRGAGSLGNGQCVLEDGQCVSAETSRRIACDASTLEMVHDAKGRVLDVGRKTRVVPTPIRRALEHRDRHCRFPGCTVRHCDAHHVEHWGDGGPTKLGNLALLCRLHHRAVHEEGFEVTWSEVGEPLFWRPDGRRLEPAPTLPRLHLRPRDMGRLDDCLPAGVVDAEQTLPSWTGGPVDYQWALDGIRGG